MSDLTKSQEKAIGELAEIAGAGEVTAVLDDGTVHYEALGTVYEITPRGKYTDLGTDPVNEPPVPVVEGAVQPSVEDPSSQTSPEGAGSPGTGDDLPSVESAGGHATLGETSPHGAGSTGNRPDVGSSDTAASSEPSGGTTGAGEVSPSVPEASVPTDPSIGEDGPTTVESGQQETGPGPVKGSTGSTEQGVPDPSLPSGSGTPVPTDGFMPLPGVDALPQAQREAVFEAITLADERQILADIEGHSLTSMVYGFNQGGGKVYGLSWIGVSECARAWNEQTGAGVRIAHEVEPKFDEVTVNAEVGETGEGKIYGDVPGIRVSVYAMNARTGFGLWGTATVTRDQFSKKKKDKDGRYGRTPDGFAANKALSKAQRNGLERHLPQWFKEETIARFKGQGKVDYIEGSGREVVKELPPPLTDERAKVGLKKAAELYGEYKKLVGSKSLPPARFHQLVENSQHDHDAIDRFVDYMEGITQEAREHVAGKDAGAGDE